MTGDVKRLGAAELKRELHDGGEIALLDAREEGVFHACHLLLASCVPLGRLELLIDDLVPRRGTRVVWCDDGDRGGDGSALSAARRMSALGYSDVAMLEGGIAAWEAAGYRLYSGVHVPSKAFAEVVEYEAGTPWISAVDLKALIDRGADIAIFDSRSYEEYHNNSIPTATSVPGAELVYRFTDMVPSPDTTVIVNCGGRTRSIIGAQALRNAGFRNKIMSLKDGTMAWHLAGFEVVKGATRRPADVSERGRRAAAEAASRVAARCDVRRIDKATLGAWRGEAGRTLYLLDVRTPEEYRAGHLAGARSVPGGQLVQETDAHIGTWNARVVLVDDNGVRATMTASWLKQMGFNDVAVLADDGSGGDWTSGPHVPRVLGLDPAATAGAGIAPAALRVGLAAGRMAVVDLDTSRTYAQGHIPGAWFAIRSRLPQDLAKLPKAEAIVLTSPDGALARLAAADLAAAAAGTGATATAPILVLEGGTEAWAMAGLPIETGASHMASEPVDVVLSARERGVGREEAMREYLAWEIDLVNQMTTDDDQRFRVVAG
ncbi:MAG: rhodanese-like domain-containing protein [Reyranella sp.]|uniref:rhodanese-like domain-containing protein n=1 Tax=Reyranella sp. TaxID=1929291 RepID=UPI003D114267